MKIALCDDNLTERNLLCDQLHTAMLRMGIEADIDVFYTAEDLLKATDKVFYSIFF